MLCSAHIYIYTFTDIHLGFVVVGLPIHRRSIIYRRFNVLPDVFALSYVVHVNEKISVYSKQM